MTQTTIAIVNLTAKGSGFAHRTDDGSTVFIPGTVMKASGVTALGTYSARLVPNQYRADVPYLAVSLTPVDDGSDIPLPATITKQGPSHV